MNFYSYILSVGQNYLKGLKSHMILIILEYWIQSVHVCVCEIVIAHVDGFQKVLICNYWNLKKVEEM